ncbi:MAG: hypothetical protein Q8N54_01930 [Sulfurimicrobium sp.]|nr:hypothetical protein [Sulfurimicrobium sp.]MDP2961486.1 hypothetical protein [Sulfurimicrobium sp.]MDZ7656507.1 hypothetical protein [Sulfurimicrobium sp.]
MHLTLSPARHITSTGLILACLVAIGGCNQSTPPQAEKTPATTAQASAPAAPAGNMISNVPVKGDEALPPSHPPLPAATPPHPTNDTGNPPDLNQQLAAQHPKPAGKKKLAVAVPDSVKGKWASATLAVTAGGLEKEIKLAIGDKVSLGKNLQIQLLHYLPAYTSDFQTVTSSSNEQVNPAVQIQAISNGQVLTEGWIFQNLPEFNSFSSEQVKVRLISAERTQKQ